MGELCENCSAEALEPRPEDPVVYAPHPYLRKAFPRKLKSAAELRDGYAILEKALRSGKGSSTPSETGRSLAALAVTGYHAFGKLSERWSRDAWRWGTQQARELNASTGLDGAADRRRADALVARARAVAMMLTANDPRWRDGRVVSRLPKAVQKELEGGRRAMRERLGEDWIPVVGECDPPHRGVNTGWTSFVERQTGRFRFVANVTATKTKRYEVDVRYLLEGPRNAPVVVLLHGHSSKAEELESVIGHLAEKYRVLVPDLPGGSGFTRGDLPPAPRFRSYRRAGLNYLCDFVIALVRRLRDQGELPAASKKIHFAGGSLGGNLSILLNARAKVIGGAGRFAAWSPGSAWFYPQDSSADPANAWMFLGWGVAKDAMSRDPEARRANGWRSYLKRLTEPTKLGAITLVEAQPEHWYWAGWYPDLREKMFGECYQSRREIFRDDFRIMHWQLAWEQMQFSHHGIVGEDVVPWKAYREPLLLMAGCRDNLFPERMATATHDLAMTMRADGMKNVKWRGFCDAGHSLHNERPAELARVLDVWFRTGKVA